MEIENFLWNETKKYFIVVYDIFSRRNKDEFLSQLTNFTQQVFQVLVFIYKYFKNFNYNKHEWFKE